MNKHAEEHKEAHQQSIDSLEQQMQEQQNVQAAQEGAGSEHASHDNMAITDKKLDGPNRPST